MKYFISENTISQVLKIVAGAILIYAVIGFFVSVYLIEDGDFLMVSSSFLMDQILKLPFYLALLS